MGLFKGKIIPEDLHILYYDSFVSCDTDALLEELESSTLQDSSEYSNPAPLPVGQCSRKESNCAETLSIQDDTSPLPVTFELLECF